MRRVQSVLIWAGIILLVLFWLPLVAVVRLFDRSPDHYRTGFMFRKLGLFISRINPNWKVNIEGRLDIDHRQPYVMVSNHLSNADIPVISNLPWEMKWVAKKELFDMPVVGWMMRMAGDIPVNRKAASKPGVFKRCKHYLDKNTSVMFFPEGTRSRSGLLNRFAQGAFELAIREKIPILPIVLDGTQDCLPKKDWIFKPEVFVKLKVLDPIETSHLESKQSEQLIRSVRDSIKAQLAEWRELSPDDVDGVKSLHQVRDTGLKSL